jgi:hypothetical protein
MPGDTPVKPEYDGEGKAGA